MIKELQGEHRFLSNFYPFDVPLVIEGISYPTLEHFYVAMKTDSIVNRKRIAAMETPGQAKRYGSAMPIREDWESIKVEVMQAALAYKFSSMNPNLKQLLLDTGEELIQEGNNWNDTFWGVSLRTGEGQNQLGIMLMVRRMELQKELAHEPN